MEFKTIISLIILLSYHVASLASLPTFGEEHVHIKVHVPKDVADTHGHLKSTFPGSPRYPHISHKVIHHYHRRRKPFKKSSPRPKTPLLEEIILAELEKPHVEEPVQPLEETFVVKEVQPEQKIKTFKVIEESVQNPLHGGYKVAKTSFNYNNDHEESFHIVNSNDHQKHGCGHVDEPDEESIKLEEDKKNHRHLHQDKYSHVAEYAHQKPRKESITIIETPESKPSEHYKEHNIYHHHHHDHHYQKHASDESQHYQYKTPHVESLEILNTKKAPRQEPHSKYYENDESEDYNPNGYHKETIEIIKTKSSPKYHQSVEYESHDANDLKPEKKEIIQVEKKIIYTKPREAYTTHRESVNPSYSYFSSKDVKPITEDQIENEKPSRTYAGQHLEYGKPSVIYREYDSTRNPSSGRAEHDVYGDKDDYHHYSAGAADNYHNENSYYHEKSPSTTTQSHNSYYYPNPQREGISNSDTEKYKTSYRYKTPSSYASLYETGLQYNTSPQTFPSEDSKSESSNKYQEPPASASSISSHSAYDELYDELLPAVVKKPQLSSNIDWPEDVRKSQATETYKGYDSYSVGHVQGVDSGGYHYTPQ